MTYQVLCRKKYVICENRSSNIWFLIVEGNIQRSLALAALNVFDGIL